MKDPNDVPASQLPAYLRDLAAAIASRALFELRDRHYELYEALRAVDAIMRAASALERAAPKSGAKGGEP